MPKLYEETFQPKDPELREALKAMSQVDAAKLEYDRKVREAFFQSVDATMMRLFGENHVNE